MQFRSVFSDNTAWHCRGTEISTVHLLFLQIKFRVTRPTSKLWLYNQCSSLNTGYNWPPKWGHAETLCTKAISVYKHRTWNNYKRRGFGKCLKQRMVVSCHTGCVWDRATATYKYLMDHASGAVHLLDEVTNVCTWIKDKHIQFVKWDLKDEFFHAFTLLLGRLSYLQRKWTSTKTERKKHPPGLGIFYLHQLPTFSHSKIWMKWPSWNLDDPKSYPCV